MLASDQVVIADRDNFVVRALGTLLTECPETPADCTGEGGASCHSDRPKLACLPVR